MESVYKGQIRYLSVAPQYTSEDCRNVADELQISLVAAKELILSKCGSRELQQFDGEDWVSIPEEILKVQYVE